MNSRPEIPDISLDEKNLYREELFSDRRAGAVRRLVPVKSDGADDPTREVLYEGQTSLMTAAGSLPISFELKAKSLDEAIRQFPQAAREEVERTLEELQELRRQSSSSIVTPGSGGGGFGGAGGMGGSGGGGFSLG